MFQVYFWFYFFNCEYFLTGSQHMNILFLENIELPTIFTDCVELVVEGDNLVEMKRLPGENNVGYFILFYFIKFIYFLILYFILFRFSLV